MDFLKLLEGIRTPFFNQLFQFFTFFGEELFVIALLCGIYWCIDKKLAYKISFTYFASGLLVQTLKITFRIERPWILDPEFKPVPSAMKTATGYSFPSGHTQSATALFSSLAFSSKKTVCRFIFTAFFFMVAFSRMYLGVHTPKDVLVSMILTFLLSYGVHLLMEKVCSNHQKDLQTSIVLAAIAFFALCYSLLLLKTGFIGLKYASDCCKAAGAGLGFAVGYYLERRYIQFDPCSKSRFFQTAKYLIGLLFTIIIKTASKTIFGTSLFASVCRYLILILWVTAVYPFLLKNYRRLRNY